VRALSVLLGGVTWAGPIPPFPSPCCWWGEWGPTPAACGGVVCIEALPLLLVGRGVQWGAGVRGACVGEACVGQACVPWVSPHACMKMSEGGSRPTLLLPSAVSRPYARAIDPCGCSSRSMSRTARIELQIQLRDGPRADRAVGLPAEREDR
jgi:hypothetical protein